MNVFKRFLGEEDDYEDEDMETEEQSEHSSAQTATAVSSRPAVRAQEKTAPEFVLVKPVAREDLASIADNLIARKTIVLNLELVSKDTKRFVDFLSGVAYALQGQVKKIADGTFLIIPGGVVITGDIFDDFEEDGY